MAESVYKVIELVGKSHRSGSETSLRIAQGSSYCGSLRAGCANRRRKNQSLSSED